jgi:hypothetical protein
MGRPTRFAFGQSSRSFPIAACDFLEIHRDLLAHLPLYGDTKAEDMFLNRFAPDWKTYIDGRHGEIYDAPFFQDYGRTLGVRGAFFDEAARNGIGYAMFCVQDMPQGRSDLAAEIHRHPGWSLIYLDECGVLFAANVPTNAPVIGRYALPPPPAAMDEQRAVFGAWMARHGFREPHLYRSRNENLLDTPASRAVLGALRLGGLFAPQRNIEAWHRAQTASFLASLGWNAVADDVFESLPDRPSEHAGALERALNHGVACADACVTAEARAFYIGRVQRRAERLLRAAPRSPAGPYGLAYCALQRGDPAAAAGWLEPLARRSPQPPILDHLVRAYGEQGDAQQDPAARRLCWERAMETARRRLTLFPSGPGTYRIHVRMGDLALRLDQPLVARGSFMNALRESDLPPPLAERVLAHVTRLERDNLGVSFVPGTPQPPGQPNPYVFPPAGAPSPGAPPGAVVVEPGEHRLPSPPPTAATGGLGPEPGETPRKGDTERRRP